MVLDPHGHDIKLNSSTTSVALTLTIVLAVLQNLTTSTVVIEKSGERKHDHNLPELDVVTKRIRYRLNGVLITVE